MAQCLPAFRLFFALSPAPWFFNPKKEAIS